ncbi:MAG: hypothetical protein ACXWT1_15705 [Methylobacter sp.]
MHYEKELFPVTIHHREHEDHEGLVILRLVRFAIRAWSTSHTRQLKEKYVIPAIHAGMTNYVDTHAPINFVFFVMNKAVAL